MLPSGHVILGLRRNAETSGFLPLLGLGSRGTAVLDETVCSDAGRQKISTLESVVGGLMCHGGRARVLVV